MANFVVRTCTPGPRVDVIVTAPDTGELMRLTTYRGLVEVTVDTNKGSSLATGTLAFTLPDSLPYSRENLAGGATAAGTVALIGLAPIVAEVRAAVDSVEARFVEGPAIEESSRVLLSIGLQTTSLLEAFAVRLSYEIMTVVPHR